MTSAAGQPASMRDYFGKSIASLRTTSEAVDYEFGVNKQQHLRASEMIIEAALTAAAVFWNQLAFLHQEQDRDFLEEPRLAEMRRKLAGNLDIIANSVIQKTAIPASPAAAFVDAALLTNPRYGEYARNSVARYEALQATVAARSAQP